MSRRGQMLLQIQPRVRLLIRRNLFRRAFGHQIAAPIAALRPQVDDPIRHLDDVRVVLDDDDAVALIDQRFSTSISLCTSAACRPDRRLIQDVERVTGGALAEFAAELHALRLAAATAWARAAPIGCSPGPHRPAS